jgi:hypothetical protein
MQDNPKGADDDPAFITNVDGDARDQAEVLREILLIYPETMTLEDDPTAAPTLSIFERSVGARPTLLVSPDDGEVPILFRDGSRRIFPFNFMVGPDSPPG